MTILITGNDLTFEQLANVAYDYAEVKISPDAVAKIKASRKLVEETVASGKVVYSINTGFGALSDITIPSEDLETLQRNFLLSHAAGTGKLLTIPEVRAMLLLRANTLAKGYSGVRLELIERLLDFLNLKIHPAVPSQGSLGASGDLAPLAHLALPLIGEGQILIRHGELVPAADILKQHQLTPLVLSYKEGLALTNGTQMMTAIGVLNAIKAERLCKLADIAACMSVEGFRGSHYPFAKSVQDARPHPGQEIVSAFCRKLLENSEIANSHVNCKKVQDPYSFRCIPQVHGAVRDTLDYVKTVLLREMNSATDNPLVFSEDNTIISQGNFHGEPVAFALDFLGIAMAELGNIAERRIDKLNDPNFSELPAFLSSGKEGLNSGTMIAQYTAASLVSENKLLAHPASIDSIPSSNNKEDHVSMGSIAARKLTTILEHLEYILATEVFCATQSLYFAQSLKAGNGVQKAFDYTQKLFPKLLEDRLYAEEIKQFQKNLNGFLQQF